MIADMLSNKELNPIVTELFIRGRKINISHFSFILAYRKILDEILHTKFQTNESFNKMTSRLLESLRKIYSKIIFIFSN